MSDLSKRLRECDPHVSPDTAQIWMREAADALDELTKAINRIKGAIKLQHLPFTVEK